MSRRLVALAAFATGLLACGSDAPFDARDAAAPSSLAVLPLLNVSVDAEESDYIASGISRAVITKLTQAGFQVTPWETARRYEGSDERAVTIAEDLNVDAVLVGTFELIDERILTTLSLVNVETGLQTWTDQFQETYDDIFELQQRIAMGAATRLTSELTGEEEKAIAASPSESVDAYDYYLQAAHLLLENDIESSQVSLELFSRALEIDPKIADARVGSGAARISQYLYGGGTSGVLELAKRDFERALEIDPNAMPARRGLIFIAWYEGNSEACLRQGALAARHPRPDDLEQVLTRAMSYVLGGLPDLSLPLFRRALEIDPQNQEASFHYMLSSWQAQSYEVVVEAGESYLNRFSADVEVLTHTAMALHTLGNSEKAEHYFERASEMPSSFHALFYGGNFFAALGRPKRAEEFWRKGAETTAATLETAPENLHLKLLHASFEGSLGNDDALHAVVRDVRETTSNPWEIIFPAVVFARRGDSKRSAELLQLLLDRGLVTHIWKSVFDGAGLDPHDDPAFESFLDAFEAEHARLREVYGP